MRCFFFFICFSTLAYSSILTEKRGEGEYHAEFGSCIGQSYLTKAYSSYNDDVKDEYNFIFLEKSNKKIISGVKWQCVEYARRRLIENKM